MVKLTQEQEHQLVIDFKVNMLYLIAQQNNPNMPDDEAIRKLLREKLQQAVEDYRKG